MTPLCERVVVRWAQVPSAKQMLVAAQAWVVAVLVVQGSLVTMSLLREDMGHIVVLKVCAVLHSVGVVGNVVVTVAGLVDSEVWVL